MDDDDHGDDEAEPATDDETGREGHAVEEAVDAHPARADDPDVSMGGVAVVELGRAFVADVDGRQLLDDIEREEADRRREHGLVEVPVQEADGLRDQVEEGGPDPDPRPDGDDHPDVADGTEGEEPAEEGRDEGRGGHRERGHRHASSPVRLEAGGAQPEQLEPVLVHAKSRLAGDLADDRPEARVVDLVGPAAARADDVVVMDGIAADVGMLARRQVQALDGAEPLEDLERPEDRRSSDPESARPGLGDEIGGGEVAGLIGDERRERPARLGQAIAGAVERGDVVGRFGHGRETTTS